MSEHLFKPQLFTQLSISMAHCFPIIPLESIQASIIHVTLLKFRLIDSFRTHNPEWSDKSFIR